MKCKKLLTLILAFGLAFSAAALPAYAETMVVTSGTTNNVNVRSGPGTDYDTIASVPVGTSVEVLGTENGWYKISVNGTTGYVRTDLLKSSSSTDSSSSADNSSSSCSSAADETDSTDNSSSSTDSTSTADTSSDDSEGTDSEGTDSVTGIMVSGVEYTIADSLSNIKTDSLPEGCTESSIDYAGTQYPAFYIESADVYIVYMENDSDGGFFVFDAASQAFIPYTCITEGETTIIFLNAPSGFDAGDDYQTVAFPADEKGVIKAYQESTASESSDAGVDTSSLYTVYAKTTDGYEGWVTYDSELKSATRTTEPETEVSDTDIEEAIATGDSTDSSDTGESTKALKKKYNKIIAVLIIIIVLLIIVTVNVVVFRGRKREDDDFFDDEDFGAFDDDDMVKEAEEIRKTLSRRNEAANAQSGQGTVVRDPEKTIKSAAPSKDLSAGSSRKDDDINMIDLN